MCLNSEKSLISNMHYIGCWKWKGLSVATKIFFSFMSEIFKLQLIVIFSCKQKKICFCQKCFTMWDKIFYHKTSWLPFCCEVFNSSNQMPKAGQILLQIHMILSLIWLLLDHATYVCSSTYNLQKVQGKQAKD